MLILILTMTKTWYYNDETYDEMQRKIFTNDWENEIYI